MKNKLVVVVCIVILLVCGMFCLWKQKIFHTNGITKCVLRDKDDLYVVPQEVLEPLLKELNDAFLYNDTPSCGFGDTYSLLFYDGNDRLISSLYIALDGCPTFRYNDTGKYIEGHETAREIVNSFVYSVRKR